MHRLARVLYEGILDATPEDYPVWGLKQMTEHSGAGLIEWLVFDAESGAMVSRHVYGTLPGGAGDAPKIGYELVADASRHVFTFRGMTTLKENTGADDELQRMTEAALTLLVGAEAMARRFQHKMRLQQGSDPTGPDAMGYATVGPGGTIESADRMFFEHIRAVHADWDGHGLPFGFIWEPRLAASGMIYRTLFVRVDRQGERYAVKLRRDRRAPKLSEREVEIAKWVTGGYTFKEIARQLNVAPSTVSTHVYNIYAKLGFRRRAQLVEWINRQRANDDL